MELKNSGIEIKSDDQAMQNLAFLVGSNAWLDFFLPMMVNARDAALRMIVDPSQKRLDTYPDDFLRGRIRTLDDLIHLGPGTLEDHEAALRAQEKLERENEAYQERADLGHSGPLS